MLLVLSVWREGLNTIAGWLGVTGYPPAVLFAVARTVGWIAQWKEMVEDPEQKIGRPRQLYIGAGKRDYVGLDKRV